MAFGGGLEVGKMRVRPVSCPSGGSPDLEHANGKRVPNAASASQRFDDAICTSGESYPGAHVVFTNQDGEVNLRPPTMPSQSWAR